MNFTTILRLGRVSNLPTVWTNALAGAVLASGDVTEKTLMAALALSSFYIGGMWLNDAFDRHVDAIERPSRPIPSGDAHPTTVFVVGFGLLFVGVLITFLLSRQAALLGFALTAAITAYDYLHKHTRLAPVIMAATRFLSVCLGALSVGIVNDYVLWGSLGLFAYVTGLTYAAKRENLNQIDAIWPLIVLVAPVVIGFAFVTINPLACVPMLMFVAVIAFAVFRLFRRQPGDVPVAVVSLIAGIALYDATLITASGSVFWGLLSFLAFGLTIGLQRVVPGT